MDPQQDPRTQPVAPPQATPQGSKQDSHPAYFAFPISNSIKVLIRPYTPEDYDGLIALFNDAYAGIDDNYASPEDMVALLEHFPDGQIIAEIDGEVAGVILSLHCRYDQFSQPQRMADIYNPALFPQHSREGDSLFALEILVKSTHHRRGIGKALNAAITETLVQHNLRAFIGTSRLSGYSQYQALMLPEEYIRRVVAGEFQDPSLSYNISNGMMPTQIVPDYYPSDQASVGYGAIVIQPNPHYHHHLQIAASI